MSGGPPADALITAGNAGALRPGRGFPPPRGGVALGGAAAAVPLPVVSALAILARRRYGAEHLLHGREARRAYGGRPRLPAVGFLVCHA